MRKRGFKGSNTEETRLQGLKEAYRIISEMLVEAKWGDDEDETEGAFSGVRATKADSLTSGKRYRDLVDGE